MKTLGIIAEYNPFHLGHAYQLSQARLINPDHAIVVAMSGNLVQRGEFAILDKWTRANIACQHGADLVLELPLLASFQAADYFAHWGVDLLCRLDIENLIFGTEEVSTQQIKDMQAWLLMHQGDIDNRVVLYLNQGLSYPASMQLAIESLDFQPPFDFDSRQANNLLGLKYLDAIKQFNHGMGIEAIPRRVDFASGSEVRHKARQGMAVDHLVPEGSAQALGDLPLVRMEDYFILLKGQILSKSPSELENILGMREGFENQIVKVIHQVASYEELVNQLISKRWTRAAVQRILLAILLNVSKSNWDNYIQDYQSHPFVRVLAYSAKGQDLLNQYRSINQLDLFSNLTQSLYQRYDLMIRVDQIYRLPYPTIPEQNIGRYPNN